MSDVLFGDLKVDDKFVWHNEQWVVIPLVRGGSCGCTPVANCRSLNSDKTDCLHATMPVTKIEE
jgi:hypothetical protein